MTDRLCPICLSGYREIICQTLTRQRIAVCNNCGMCYAFGGEVVDYAKDSIYGGVSGSDEHYDRIVRNCYRTGDTVIDIGCSTGGLLRAFERKGATAHGISLSQREVDACNAHGSSAEVGDVARPTRKASLVTVSHVLEHIADVRSFLKALHGWMWTAPGGHLYIEVPNAMRYADLKGIAQGFNAEHINHFDIETLRLACSLCGFSVFDYGGYHADGYPVIWVRCMSVMAGNIRLPIKDYARVLDHKIKDILRHLAVDLRDVTGIAVWGMGQTAIALIASGILPYIWLATDSNPAYHRPFGNIFGVVPPDDFHPNPSIPILVCSQTAQAAIIADIKRRGLTNRIITLEVE